MKRLAVTLFALALLGTALAAAAAPDKPLAVGSQAPDFTLTDQQGKSFRLSEVLAKRQYVVLAFYVLAFTPG
ncbi:MAG: redoxin domain-containing protein [Candidatus Rokubacteria bacterium]|nr:redoxin domain-containing protein [Candidatus Rokubacteria bacterium]